jgi:hypothetical protein
MASSLTGDMRLSYSSGKPDPMARDEIGKDEPMPAVENSQF